MKKNTRELLLDSAFKTFYKQGFQGANIATILNDVGINKGSMYHFFKSKKELGLAVVKERIELKLIEKYSKIKNLQELFNTLKSAPKTLTYGCPLNKMSQEMIYLDNDFKKVLTEVYLTFETLISNITKSKSKAQLIIATYKGALMIYHLNQNREQFKDILFELERSL